MLSDVRLLEAADALIDRLDDIVAIADGYKMEIGFWPRRGLEDAIWRGRLIAAYREGENGNAVLGFVVFGGVFPNGRVQAVAVHPDYLRQGVAQYLIDAVISRFEMEGFLTVSAKPARDLEVAQSFYQKNGFLTVRSKAGGASRKREIVVRERALKSPSLLPIASANGRRIGFPVPDDRSKLWVIDLNVFLDLLKDGRANYEIAVGLFRSALQGRVRIAVTSEFTKEMTRVPRVGGGDPLLKLAEALPRVRRKGNAEVERLSMDIHSLIFEKNKPSQAGSAQALSDCMHLAESITANASAFVTSDGVLLRNRRAIREAWRLEVVALEDFCEALSSIDKVPMINAARGEGFRVCSVDAARARGVILKLKRGAANGFLFGDPQKLEAAQFIAAYDSNDREVALLASWTPSEFGQEYEISIFVDQSSPRADVIADTMLGYQVDTIGRCGVSLIKLDDVPGQLSVRKVAQQRGFVLSDTGRELRKAALGAPVTPNSFETLWDKLGIIVGRDNFGSVPSTFSGLEELFSYSISDFLDIENLLGPTLIVPSSREVCIQPIARPYADELLGTSEQASFLEQREGAFRSQKVYVSSGRSRNFFKENQVVMFYESVRTGGRGAVIAAARVDNVVTQRKVKIDPGSMSRTVLENVERFSSSDEVTLTSFSSILRFPQPVGLLALKRVGAAGTQNLQTTTKISTAVAQTVFDLGWSNG
ncbi:Acetyltransferase (GNAT) family protein [Pseudooceanicola marinus]|uniref:Acetyltransferase (GNAT) family protein n=1 Tax=Pseudooceanicola marinus TaxID=396013 RepID=A0A1X6YXL7_9RHOB|nr:GNAT family N-acetyltransferase [Pseudooceanicola marinus]PJE32647.1 N-acetyltransferase [Pseudooceanicola marinus]SLN34707.1 Acetyltransferase (GNAT) family protein [Pseudooceanicola marinus]